MSTFVASVASDAAEALHRCAALAASAGTPFQRIGWLTDWYATLGREPEVAPLVVIVERDGVPVMLVPLASRREGRLRVATFADGGVTDYNAPWLGDVTRADSAGIRAALRRALADHDLLRLDKMLPAAGGLPNPLDDPAHAQPGDIAGNRVVITTEWDAWRHSLDKTVRKEFERCWRVFCRDPRARFDRVREPDAALALYGELEAQQRTRMAHAGDRYQLDRPAISAFYRERLLKGLADGSVVLTALRCGDELVAALYGICDGRQYTMLRISHAGEAWKHCAPGKLLIERTMHHLYGEGLREFDFAIGDYFHKRVFKVTSIPLRDACTALSRRGLPAMWMWRVRRSLKRRPWLPTLVRRVRSVGSG